MASQTNPSRRCTASPRFGAGPEPEQDAPGRSGHIVTAFSGMSGRQGGDPAKLAAALTQLMSSAQPPLRRPAGGDAVSTLEQKAKTLLDQAEAHRDLSSSHHPGT